MPRPVQTSFSRAGKVAISNVAVLSALLFGACVKSVTTSLSTKVPPASYVAPTRSANECRAIANGPDADAFALTMLDYHDRAHQNPVPKEIYIPDLHDLIPWAGVAGNVVATVRVNEKGFVMPDSVRITGIAESQFTKRVRAAVSRGLYWPAVRLGCAVPGWHAMSFSTPGSP